MITSDETHKKWEIAIKDMHTQRFYCERLAFPYQVIAQAGYDQQNAVIGRKMADWLDRNEQQLSLVRSISAGAAGYFEI
jgi:hypothetical protein